MYRVGINGMRRVYIGVQGYQSGASTEEYQSEARCAGLSERGDCALSDDAAKLDLMCVSRCQRVISGEIPFSE